MVRSDRTYRHGGGDWATEIALRTLSDATDKLAERGKLMVFTGTPVLDGTDLFAADLEGLLNRDAWSLDHAEVDPDIYPEELPQEPYSKADRIAAVFLAPERKHL
jgi:hypothetical protein